MSSKEKGKGIKVATAKEVEVEKDVGLLMLAKSKALDPESKY